MAEVPAISEIEVETLDVYGARVHNLKNIDVSIPRNQLIVLTGISGSGKSSLAFDTIYAEGQRRYMESFSAYVRQFLGGMERPDVDKITGLSPVISIEQKTTNKNPRSTVGTTTELYDFMRLLFAKVGQAYSYETGKKMVRFTENQIIDHISDNLADRRLVIMAPLVKGRKGHYREMFEKVRQQGFIRVRVDGEMLEIIPNLKLDRYKVHDIEVVVDKVKVNDEMKERLRKSVHLALELGHEQVVAIDYDTEEEFRFSKQLMCPESGISYDDPSPNAFSFNSPYGACPHCKGMGEITEIDYDSLIEDKNLSINRGGIAPLGERKENKIFKIIQDVADEYNFSLSSRISNIPDKGLNMLLYGNEEGDPHGAKKQTERRKKRIRKGWYFDGLVEMIRRSYNESSSDKMRQWAESFMTKIKCPTCEGARLKKESRHFFIGDKNIADLAQMDVKHLSSWFDRVEDHVSERQMDIARDIIKEIRLRLGFLLNVGLDYLALDRPARSLSGGESQRIRLATQIGSQLVGITYILDEPSIGLHQRDNNRLIDSLHELSDAGNTVMVVEHDKDIMKRSNYIIDLGPGAGEHGGHIVAEGQPDSFAQNDSLTAEYLRGEKNIEVPPQRRKGNGKDIVLHQASGNNLRDVKLKMPLGKMVCVTGVSGSGKSSLINGTLYPILRQHIYKSRKKPLSYNSVKGLKNIDKVIDIDQSPIGRTPRSNPATYIGVFSDIRSLFAQLPEAQIRGYKAGRFSFNVKSGRCEECGGAGVKIIEMNFLPDVSVTCPKCLGRRYNRETLEVRYKGKSISDVLDMSVEEATTFFEKVPKIYRRLKTLTDVGLGYVRLGQSATTLSGGEAQRIKLAAELSKQDTGSTFHILDEPTTGLHFDDIRILLDVLNKLVDKGNTVVIIEHNIDVIKVADHIIDLGPEGGDAGGQIIASGTPEQLTRFEESHTGAYLKEELDV